MAFPRPGRYSGRRIKKVTVLKVKTVPETLSKWAYLTDKAMATGSLDETYKLLDQAIQNGLDEKHQAVLKARAEVEKPGAVEAPASGQHY